jgi:bacteriorhodopsin
VKGFWGYVLHLRVYEDLGFLREKTKKSSVYIYIYVCVCVCLGFIIIIIFSQCGSVVENRENHYQILT